MNHIYDVRSSIPGRTKKIIGKIKAAHIDTALGLARLKYGYNVTVETYEENYIPPTNLPWPEVEAGLITYEQTKNEVAEEHHSGEQGCK